jgi:hypothetical protein
MFTTEGRTRSATSTKGLSNEARSGPAGVRAEFDEGRVGSTLCGSSSAGEDSRAGAEARADVDSRPDDEFGVKRHPEAASASPRIAAASRVARERIRVLTVEAIESSPPVL